MSDRQPRGARRSWLPRRTWSRLVGRLGRSERSWIRVPLIRGFMRAYDVSIEDCVISDPRRYPTFNAFFTRTYTSSARPLDTSADGIACPCDGTISRVDRIAAGQLVQAKGIDYALDELVADAGLAARLDGGEALTIYLSPRDYHRVHAPAGARFSALRHAGTESFSVRPSITERQPGLYLSNERAVLEFTVDTLPLVVVMVGAIGVGSISTRWDRDALPDAPDGISKGDEIGRFNLGSTVILIAPAGFLAWRAGLHPGQTLKVGERIARRIANA